MERIIKKNQKNYQRVSYVCMMACLMLSCMQQEQQQRNTNLSSHMTQQEQHDTSQLISPNDDLFSEQPMMPLKEKKVFRRNENHTDHEAHQPIVVNPPKEKDELLNGNKYDSADEDIYYHEEQVTMQNKTLSQDPEVSSPPMSIKDREQFLKTKKLTLSRLKYMGFMFVKMNTENMKSVQEIYDSGSMDKLIYERTKLGIEKNLRIVRLLNKIAKDKALNDTKFAAIYLEQLVTVVKDGLVVSQEVLRYLQSIYDTQQVSQQKYIASADNLKTNVNLMWDIIKEIDF